MIHYFSIWGENNLGRELSYSPAGLKKAKYVLDVLSRIDTTRVVSFASGGSKWNGFYHSLLICDNNQEFYYCSTFGSSNKYLRMIERWFNILQMVLYILKLSSTDIVVFYHERYFSHAIRFCRFIRRKPKLILQVEEVYSLAGNYPLKMIRNEIDYIRKADAYILVNDIISEKLTLDTLKPFCVSYGPYQLQNSTYVPQTDNRIHIVYAGVIDKIKRGAEMAVKACKFLPKNYCLHVAGFGNDVDVAYLKSLIEEVNKEGSCEILYEGCLIGSDYNNLMNKCSIGLSTQVSGEFKYAETSFPSKVISYLSYGLSVVTTKIKVLELCEISDLLSFYNSDDPEVIADAIRECPIIEKKTAQERILKLDKEFEQNLRNIVQDLSVNA